MYNILQFLLRNSKGSAKAVQQVAGIFIQRSQQKSSLLNLVKRKRFDDKVDYVFSKEKRQALLRRLRNKPTLREQWKRLTKKGSLKRAFKTLSLEYIKRQLWFAKNQGRLMGSVLSASKVIQPVSDARAVEKSILRRLTLTNKKGVVDSSPLNSSWCYRGTWMASTSQEDYWVGTFNLTVKHEYPDGRVVIGKTCKFWQLPPHPS